MRELERVLHGRLHVRSSLRRLRSKYLRNLGILLRRRQELAAALQVRPFDAVVKHLHPVVPGFTTEWFLASNPRTPLNALQDAILQSGCIAHRANSGDTQRHKLLTFRHA